jgi:hypothetical protein
MIRTGHCSLLEFVTPFPKQFAYDPLALTSLMGAPGWEWNKGESSVSAGGVTRRLEHCQGTGTTGHSTAQ